MSEILKYKKALNFRANPRYLRRDFIVPLYTGTEPDIVPEASVEEQGMVVDPSRILPKNFTDDMPFVTDENNPEQLELNEGGRVGFQKAGRVFGELPQDIKQYKGTRLNTFEEGLNDLIKWKKNPTSDNWIKIFGYKSASGQSRTSEFSKNLRSYLKGEAQKETTKELFDKIKIKDYLKDNIKDIKNLDSALIERRQTAGSQARAEQQLATSAERIKLINEQFKKNQRIGLEDLTKNIYKTKFTKADDLERLKLSTQVSDDVAKYLEALRGIRTGIPGLPTGNKLKNISDYIEKNTVLFRFREGNLRKLKFNVADKARGFGLNYTENLINKIRGKGRVADEAVGLSATFKNAPGYLEATQFLKASTNNLKGRKIDKFFIEAFDLALKGDKSKVKDYNKRALQFKNKNPNVDVPFIKYGNTLNEVKNNIRYFDDFSDVSKENILKIAKEKNIIIKTQAKPLTKIVDEFKDATNTTDKIQQAAKLKNLGLNPKQSALYTSFLPGLENLGEDLAKGKYGAAAFKGLGILGTVIGAKDFTEMYDTGEPILDTVLYGGFGIPGPVTALAKYKNFPPEGKLAEKRLDTLQSFREGIFKPQETAIVAKKLDPQYQGDPLQYLDFLEQNELNFKKDIELAEEKFQKETMQPFKEEKMKTRLPIMETPIIKKISEIYKQISPEETEETETEIEQPLEKPPEELPSEYTVSAAEGGRIGLKEGTKIGKRGFLKAAAALALTPEIIKAIKGAGQTGKIASKIKIEPAEGMYPWFPKLVEKVKEMGKPFEEKQLIMEPSYKNSPRPFTSRPPTGEEKLTKHVDGDTTFILREYPDGRLAVDIDSPRNQQSFGQPVSLYYRPKMEIQNYKGEKKIEPPEFKVLEPEPRPFVTGPDDVDITFTEIPKNPKRDIVFADIEAAERFATGNIKNRKIIPVKQSLRNEMEEDPSTFIMRESGELGSKARPEEIIKKTEDFATGGRVGFGDGSKDPNKLIPIDPLLQDQSPTDPGKRDVLKLGIAGAGILGLGKLGLLKLGSSIKPSVFAEAVKGTTAPSWMDSLMTKILTEGTEIKMPKESGIIKKEVQFKNPETGDVQTATLTIDSKEDRMFIAYDSPTNVAKQPVVLELYRERKVVPNPGGESNWFAPDKTKGYNFYATETGPRVVDYDGTIEFDAEDTAFKIIDLKSDISGLKSYATGGKGIDKKIAKQKRAATADIEKNPEDYVPDWEPEIYD